MGNLRLVELKKDSPKNLEAIGANDVVRFVFNNQKYEANVGSAIFSKKDLDIGTRFLLDVVLKSNVELNSKSVADLGAGWGAISLVIAKEFPEGRISAYEKDEASFEALKRNLAKHRNVSIKNIDLTENWHFSDKEKMDYVISNPPFHINESDREVFFKNAKGLLKTSGEIFFVAEGSFVGRFRNTAIKFFRIVEEAERGRYTVFRYTNA